MSQLNLDNLTPEQKTCLGRVYQLVIKKSQQYRAKSAKLADKATPKDSEIE